MSDSNTDTPDRPDSAEAEVTPEMIEAGKYVLYGSVMMEDEKVDLVTEIYRAMRRARILDTVTRSPKPRSIGSTPNTWV